MLQHDQPYRSAIPVERATAQPLVQAALLVLAVMVTFPPPIPGAPAGMRPTEILSLVSNAALLLALLSGASLHRAAIPLGIAALLSILWIIAEVISMSLMTASGPAHFALVRWVMGLATGYWLAVLMDDPRYRRTVGLGLILGLVLSVGTILQDSLTFDPTAAVDLTPDAEEVLATRWGEDGTYRAAGIFIHPNNAAAVGLLIVPLIIGFVEERRLPRLALLLAAVAIGVVFLTTQTRGSSGVAALLLIMHLLRSPIAHRLIVVVLLLEILVLGILSGLLPLDAVLHRFAATGENAENLGGRLETTLYSLLLALENPLGLGSRYVPALQAATGFSATHNAYLQLALMGGLPLALFVTARLLSAAFLRAPRGRVTESWVALYMLGSFFFENLFFAPPITLFTIWLLWRPTTRA
ncbi:O-antigen ligase family protein [Roseicella aquatilis]|uniref:O-antigen ligase-related domain-containing protein n=1 Tax=Roseicella aquatilis TaxID=2527868 RepID=A0A4R4DU10_9PROT|nr:O-antigen ligase family protein [Roseicella aquatilis]TCZ63630.1 hypothetical protein EXY23_09605 [Roseicella aquatilis]